MTLQPRPGVLDIHPYVPGASGPKDAVKLSSNENPLGCSPKAAEAFTAAAASLNRYPDGGATRLREAIAKAEGLDADRIVCGAGSDELLQLIGRAYLAPGDTVVQSQYGFLVYGLVALQSGARLVSAPEKAHRADVDAMIAAARETEARIVFLANPNNPTGTWIPDAEVERLREGLPDGTLLVLDGAYAEYLDDPAFDAGMRLAGEREDVIVTRTFSKIHGLAALRLGWAYGPASIIDVLHRVRGPFNVSLPAIEAGAAAIADRAFIERSRRHNAEWAAWLTQQIGGAGFEVTPSAGNFLLVHFPDEPGRTAAEAEAFLASKGLIVRGVGAYGLPRALRITIGREADCRAVADALAAFGGR
jgi:histidinol-phosphate aminotransferase